ncbi:MAG: hypothetical protein NWE83_08210 [Candidatus Bathyarchaeota archaeon]|nr:hypothetical protein [Candidatus Bathyarchaeota archaeon]
MDVQTIMVVITGVSIIIGVILSLSSRKQELETRQAQLFMDVNQRFNSAEMRRSLQKVLYVEDWTNYEDWAQKYGLQSDLWVAITQIGSYFGGLGVYVERGLIDPTMIDDLMGEYIIAYWDKLTPKARARKYY